MIHRLIKVCVCVCVCVVCVCVCVCVCVLGACTVYYKMCLYTFYFMNGTTHFSNHNACALDLIVMVDHL